MDELHHQTNHWRSHLATAGVRAVVFDLSFSNYLGSEFLGALIAILNECERLGGSGAICHISDHMASVLDVVRPVKSIGMYDSLEAACEYVLAESSTQSPRPSR